MNEPSQQRVEWATDVAMVYARHPGVRAIILGGSTARGLATEHSDIDLGVFWTKVASQEDRAELIKQVGGILNRSVSNHLRFPAGNPRQQGCIEIVTFRPSPSAPVVRLDLEHETVAGTDQVLVQVMDEWDLSLEKQELISVIQAGVALHGHEIIGRWREKSNDYPDELAHKMVAEHISGIGNRLEAQVGWAQTQDWFCLYEGLLNVGRRLVLCLLGLNRVWAFTDNPDFKGIKRFIDELELKPPDFVHRLGLALQNTAFDSIGGFAGLTDDVLELIETHMPSVNTHRDRATLQEVRERIASGT